MLSHSGLYFSKNHIYHHNNPNYNLGGYSSNDFTEYECAPFLSGCIDPLGCNFSPNNNVDDNSCEYPEQYYDCEGNCGGPAIIDNCGICSMGFTGHVPNSDMDCEGNCGGSAIIDDCGVCNGAGPNITCWNNSLVCNYDECPFNPSECPLGTTYMENYLGNNNAENAEKCIPQNFIEVNSSPEQAF